jgi:D-sedoheptulose 7-phosphate isomerase
LKPETQNSKWRASLAATELGKSTLLKILSGITKPTRGHAEIQGRVSRSGFETKRRVVRRDIQKPEIGVGNQKSVVRLRKLEAKIIGRETRMTKIDYHIHAYSERLSHALSSPAMGQIPLLGETLREAWKLGRTVYLCGNGGSAGNALHIANDLLYGAGISNGGGLKVEALSANSAVLTCLANDLGYDSIFAEQIKVKAIPGDVLIILSGSGNSLNVVKALEIGNAKGMRTFAILGYSGGLCKEIAQHSIHFEIDDMQIAEDLQLIVGHICMQWLNDNPVNVERIEVEVAENAPTNSGSVQVR